jgi:ArsR family transcriptional regulator
VNDRIKNNEYAEILKALANPARLCMLQTMLSRGPVTVTDMQQCLCAPQSTVSQHVSKLKALGIITGERHGREVLYDIKNELAEKIIHLLYDVQEETHG